MHQNIVKNYRAINQQLGEPKTWAIIPNETYVLTDKSRKESSAKPLPSLGGCAHAQGPPSKK